MDRNNMGENSTSGFERSLVVIYLFFLRFSTWVKILPTCPFEQSLDQEKLQNKCVNPRDTGLWKFVSRSRDLDLR